MIVRCTLTFILLLLMLLPLEGRSEPKAYYGEKARGWFWKEAPPPLHSPPKPPQAAAVKALPDASANPTDQGPKPLSAAWFRQELGRFRDVALDRASEEDVLRYFRLQRLLVDKAERFSETARRLVIRHPEIDENRRHPIAPFAKEAEQSVRDQALRTLLKTLGMRSGLLLVHRSDCPYCLKMAPLLEALSSENGIRLYALSLDGLPLRGLVSARPLGPHAMPKGLSPTVTPALFLMVPGRGFEPVAEGALSLQELTERLALLAGTLGLIPESLLKTLRGVDEGRAQDLQAVMLKDLASLKAP